MHSRLSYILHLAPLALALLLAKVFDAPTVIMSFFGLFAVIAQGYVLGPRLLPKRHIVISAAWGSIASITIQMIVRTLWFYAGIPLDSWGDVWTTVIMLAVGIVWLVCETPNDADDAPSAPVGADTRVRPYALTPLRPDALFPLGLSLCGLALIAFAAFRASTTDAIRTPWPLLPQWTLLIIALLWILALVSMWRGQSKAVTLIQTVCALGATCAIAPLLYSIGYGFDGFLHVAGETVLLKTSVLLPRPPYYMGQYVFVVWIARLFDLSIATIDRWLVPFLAAVMIPSALSLATGRDTKHSVMLPALILLPLGAFVATTPHGFATLLGVIALLLCINLPTAGPLARWPAGLSPTLPILFATWSALTHPLVGLPILVVTLMLALMSSFGTRTWAKFFAWLLAIGAGIVVPLVFGLASGVGSAAGVNFHLSKLFDPGAWQPLLQSWIPWVSNRYTLWPAASVWIEKLLPLFTIALALLAVFNNSDSESEKRKAKSEQLQLLLAATSVALAGIVLQLAGDFNFLIDYERGNYADRLFMVAWLLLLPLAIPELGRIFTRVKRGSLAGVLAVIVMTGITGAAATYAALPRNDAVTTNRGWSVGQADVDAVKLINDDSNGRNYTVLANQSVSAAAVRTFGFKRYNNDVFFYPIPTGGPLYRLYLNASYTDPTRDVMREAGRLGDSDLVYFVLNNYWWRAPEMMDRAEMTADRSFVIQEGKVKIFKYDLTKPSR
jgi:hypothetical protein